MPPADLAANRSKASEIPESAEQTTNGKNSLLLWVHKTSKIESQVSFEETLEPPNLRTTNASVACTLRPSDIHLQNIFGIHIIIYCSKHLKIAMKNDVCMHFSQMDPLLTMLTKISFISFHIGVFIQSRITLLHYYFWIVRQEDRLQRKRFENLLYLYTSEHHSIGLVHKEVMMQYYHHTNFHHILALFHS